MRKLIKNKFVVLAISIIVVSIVYFGVQKAIDNYTFRTNSDISTEEGDFENDDGTEESGKQAKYSDDELDLVLEETEPNGEDATSDENIQNDNSVGDGTNVKEENDADGQVSLEDKIYVYITGEVNVPGVVILNEGSRIVDAINAAGGTTSKANVSKVNLVYVLEDGMKVNIPSDSDLKNNPDFEYITMSSGDGRSDNSSSNTSRNPSASNSSGTETSQSSNYSIVNINTATQTELETLPGIGPSLALKIINYRNENGKFSSIEEIKNVSGIGEVKFEEMKNYITV